MIITIYHKNGKKERRPAGYGGELCSQATKPYEKRELGMSKTPTPEADLPPVIQEQVQEEAQTQKVR